MGLKQVSSSIVLPSLRKGTWEDQLTQLITHQHHSCVWINWITYPEVQAGKNNPNVLLSGSRFFKNKHVKQNVHHCGSCQPSILMSVVPPDFSSLALQYP